MSLDVAQFRTVVVTPTLRALDLWSPSAEALVLGTAVHESRLTYLRQIGGGPALGLYQIEPATHADLYRSYLDARAELKTRAMRLLAPSPDSDAQLATNLAYATAVCRLLYFRAPAPLPASDDVDGLAAYWKAHYNTPAGKGAAAEWAHHFQEASTCFN
jgi:hypothetical protein